MAEEILKRTLKGKRILLTGGFGFLGEYVYRALLAARADPKDIFRPRHAEMDLTRWENCKTVVQGAEIVIHLAARVGGIGYNQRNPGKIFYENILMGVQLMEAARIAGVSKYAQVGTVCAYPRVTPTPFVEDSLWDGYPEDTNAPYGVAKKALLVQAQAYRQQYGFDAIYLLPTNLYGPGDNFDPEDSHVIPALIRKCVEATQAGTHEIVLWGSGEPSREFLFVEDCAEGIVLATERYDGRDPVNLGSGTEISIRSLAEMVARECNFRGTIAFDPTKPDGQPRRFLDTSRALKFGFKARTSLRDGLQKTVAWYLSSR
jgi:GDP-L-fucose synthase